MDEKAVIIEARLRIEEAREEGFNEGFEDGFNEGIEQGVRQVIVGLLENGFSDEDIVNILKRSHEEVQLIRKSVIGLD
ncbi:hypothetical protein SAMN05880501_101714 [Ureibacillus xyleni]|uniref:Uncharacterized protein n=1 Tax=Ureibacillus xyleni TaxID=614648 RepID=A0A285RJM0_9BACL|nr:hypothetical protein [Ureibacillus xyleni]SOB93869.1 hypothetical protein SAMN05880501_101714 [Ureibacillus xyleni]